MRLSRGKYECDSSSLSVIIHKVYFQNETYAKVKLSLISESGLIRYDHGRKYKLNLGRIGHWRRV